MKLESFLYQKSYLYFIGFFLLMLAGFWLTYFTIIPEQENYRMHLHGITLITWCVLLILQPLLIMRKNYRLHQRIGKASYFVVALIAFTTIDIYKYRLNQQTSLNVRDYFATASVLLALAIFLIFYWLAIYNKNNPGVHARYMVCTVFAMFTAVFDRMIDSYFPSMLPYLPELGGQPVLQVVGLTLGDFILLGLCTWDWFSHKRFVVFPVALSIHLVYHYAVLNFYKFEFWRTFCDWLFNL